jgi:hypothetical protein
MGKIKELFMEMYQSGSEYSDDDYQFEQYLENEYYNSLEFRESLQKAHESYMEYSKSQSNGDIEGN